MAKHPVLSRQSRDYFPKRSLCSFWCAMLFFVCDINWDNNSHKLQTISGKTGLYDISTVLMWYNLQLLQGAAVYTEEMHRMIFLSVSFDKCWLTKGQDDNILRMVHNNLACVWSELRAFELPARGQWKSVALCLGHCSINDGSLGPVISCFNTRIPWSQQIRLHNLKVQS